MTDFDDLMIILKTARDKGGWLPIRQAAGRLKKAIAADSSGLERRLRLALLTSFTAEPVADYLAVEAALQGIALDIYIGGYNRAVPELLDRCGPLYAFSADAIVLLAEPESLQLDAPQDDQQSLQQYLEAIRAYQEAAGGAVFVADLINPPAWPLHPVAGQREEAIVRANRQIEDFCRRTGGAYCISLDRLAAYDGYRRVFSPEMMSMARCPFSEDFLPLLAQKIVAGLCAAKGWLRKCLVLDCDNTLWGGIIGEDGPQGVALGPDWPGREFLDFQRAILELYEQGVILALNSKNNSDDILQMLREHPHMQLREEHFAAIAANWNPKPENMHTIANEINIGLDSLVFVDDSPVERDCMRQTLPQVAVVDLPTNPALFAQTLRQTGFFGAYALTEEDKKRGRMYAAQRQRTHLQNSTATLADFLTSLQMVCTIRPARPQDVKRIAQLTQRTNQFNLTTRRYSEEDIRRMMDDAAWSMVVLELSDKFGDSGTVGLAIVHRQPQAWRIDTFLMSCRVIGRQVEDALVDYLCRQAVQAGVSDLLADFIPTAKNKPAVGFWEKMNFEKIHQPGEAMSYRFDLTDYQSKTFEYLTYA